jgi:hypothetical protein
MSAPTRNDEPGLTRREEMSVSSAAMSGAPWKMAGAAGVVVTGADLALHLMGGHIDVTRALSAGTVALFAVAGGGGVCVGLVLAWPAIELLTRALHQSMVLTLVRTGPFLFPALCAAIVATIVLACAIPARSATQADPMEALRCE